MPDEPQQPWYRNGLRFTCTGCGDCCTGEPGYIWVDQDEMEKMAEHLGLDLEAFQADYTRKVGIRRTLKEFSNGDCVFLDTETRKCGVYHLRPKQCRTWPFWDSNLKSPETWQQTCEECPGSGQGKLYSLEEIEHQRKQIRI